MRLRNRLTVCIVGTAGCVGTQLHHDRLDWKGPNAGTVLSYTVYRSTGSTFSLSGVKTYSGITTTTFEDPEELPNGVSFTYIVKANFADADGGTGIASNPFTIVARNDPPNAVADGGSVYTVNQDATLTVSAVAGMLGNDTDTDSPTPYRYLRVTGDSPVAGPSNGSLTLNPDGSLTYTPVKGFFGTDTFTYKAKDSRTWTDGATWMSDQSGGPTATVTNHRPEKEEVVNSAAPSSERAGRAFRPALFSRRRRAGGRPAGADLRSTCRGS